MAYNPWYVDSILAFSFFKCPECIFDAKEEDAFQDHAIENHPLSFVLFGKTPKEEYSENLLIEDQYEAETVEPLCNDNFLSSNFEPNFTIKEDFDEAETTEKSDEIFDIIENGKKQFKCSDCDKVYSQKHALKYHM